MSSFSRNPDFTNSEENEETGYTWGFTERKIELTELTPKSNLWAWIYVDDKQLHSPTFDSFHKALNWMDDRTRNQYIKRTRIASVPEV